VGLRKNVKIYKMVFPNSSGITTFQRASKTEKEEAMERGTASDGGEEAKRENRSSMKEAEEGRRTKKLGFQLT